MLRMSKLTDYGTMVLAQLAASDSGWTTAGQVADATHLGQPTVSKLLKSLVHAGLVVSSRGRPRRLRARAPGRLDQRRGDPRRARRARWPSRSAAPSHGVCDLESYCRVGSAWQRINSSIRKALEGVSLADLQIRREPLPSLRTDLRDGGGAR